MYSNFVNFIGCRNGHFLIYRSPVEAFCFIWHGYDLTHLWFHYLVRIHRLWRDQALWSHSCLRLWHGMDFQTHDNHWRWPQLCEVQSLWGWSWRSTGLEKRQREGGGRVHQWWHDQGFKLCSTQTHVPLSNWLTIHGTTTLDGLQTLASTFPSALFKHTVKHAGRFTFKPESWKTVNDLSTLTCYWQNCYTNKSSKQSPGF